MLRERFDAYCDRQFLIFDFHFSYDYSLGEFYFVKFFFDNEGEFSGKKILEI